MLVKPLSNKNLYPAGALSGGIYLTNPWGFGLSYMALVIGVSPGEVVTFWIAVYAILIPQISTAISALSWAGLGQVMTQLIDSPRTVRLINILLGLTLFLMIPLMFWSELREILAL